MTEFSHSFPGWSTEIKSQPDGSHLYGETTDVSLSEFLSRPVKIASYTWAISAGIQQTFDPWTFFLTNSAVADKIRNYALLRGTLNIKFTINGNGFYYGRVIAAYEPLYGYNNVGIAPTNSIFRRTVFSMYPHIYLDSTTSQGGIITAPTILPENWIDLTGGTYSDLGRINLQNLSVLRHANDSSAPAVSVIVHAWMTDVHFAVPTTAGLDSLTPQAGVMSSVMDANADYKDEHGQGIVSGISSGVAAVAGALSKVPVIAPFAKATSMVAKGVGKVARFFGFSRPPVLEPPKPYVHRPFGNFAVCDLDEAVQKLTVDSKQELTIDPRTVGLSDVDELSIKNIAERETYFFTYTWQDSDAIGSPIMTALNSPMHFHLNGAGYNLTSISFASLPFRYWKGTLIYKFMVMASAHHKGRLRVVWDPHNVPATEPESNVVNSKVIDIAETREFEIAIGWGQKYSWLDCPKPGVYTTMSGGVLSERAGTNGTLALYVHNQLTRPGTSGNSVYVGVTVRAGPDFELASPGNYIDGYTWVEPQSGETDTGKGTSGQEEHLPETAPTMTPMADTANSDNLVYFGEKISSFRQLLKRYCFSEALSLAGHPGGGTTENHLNHTVIQWYRHNLPTSPGDPIFSGEYLHLDDATPANGYNFTSMTMINYLMPAFVLWRGSIRNKYCYMARDKGGSRMMAVNRDSSPRLLSDCRVLSGPSPAIGGVNDSALSAWFADTKLLGHAGAAYTETVVNPVLEIETPYQVNRRCSPARRVATLDLGYKNDCGIYDSHILGAFGNNDTDDSILRFVAAGEDFSLFLYVGPPTLYPRQDPNPSL